MKIGILGCGSIARKRHAIEFKNNPNSEIKGFYSLTGSRAADMVRDFGGKVYQSEQEMFDDPEIDAVSVCTANAYHADLTIRALKAGKHVLCEKPMATTIADCEAMLEASKVTGKRLMIAQNQRLTPVHTKAKQILDSGELGRIIGFSCIYGHKGPETWSASKSNDTWFFKKSEAAFGSMGDLGIHKIDVLRYLIGGEIEQVYAYLKTLDKKFPDGTPIEVDDNSVQVLSFDSGAFGTLTTSWTYYGEDTNATVFYCEKGIMKIYVNPDYPLDVVYIDGSKAHFEMNAMQSNDDDVQLNSGVIDTFVDGILNNKSTILDVQEVIGSMRVVFACLESNAAGKTIQVS